MKRSALLLPVVLAGCTADGSGSVLGVLCIGSSAFSYGSAMVIGGFITSSINRKKPTPQSRRWGYVFGVLDLLNAAAAIAIFARVDPRTIHADVQWVLIAGAIAAVVAGTIAIASAHGAKVDGK